MPCGISARAGITLAGNYKARWGDGDFFRSAPAKNNTMNLLTRCTSFRSCVSGVWPFAEPVRDKVHINATTVCTYQHLLALAATAMGSRVVGGHIAAIRRSSLAAVMLVPGEVLYTAVTC